MEGLTKFNAVKKAVMLALAAGAYQHEARGDIDVKNLLATGDVSATEVMALLRKSRGTEHQCSPHHFDSSITVHVIKTGGWYLKFYFIEPDTWFISVHPSTGSTR